MITIVTKNKNKKVVMPSGLSSVVHYSLPSNEYVNINFK